MRRMDTLLLRRFILTATLFLTAWIPMTALMGYKTGDWRDVAMSIGLPVGLCLLYWWPLGTFLSWYRGRAWRRVLLGYVLSLPLYFVTLAAIYPIFGSVFRPFSGGNFVIYLSATPQFYAAVHIFFYLSRRLPRFMVGTATAVFAMGIVVPIILIRTPQDAWPRQNQELVAIDGAFIVDTASHRIVEGQTVYIRNGRIEAIADANLHPEWPRIDAHGSYLLPGLIDVHTHIQSPVELAAGFNFRYFAGSVFQDYAPQRQAYLAAGVTSVRDVGGVAVRAFALRERIMQRQLLGPRYFMVGRLVTSPHGHPVSTIWQGTQSRLGAILARDEQTMIDGLSRNLEWRPDAVKFVHGTIGRAREELSAGLLAKGIEWASAHRLITIVHAETAAEFEAAIRAGATGVEHAAYLQSVPQSLAGIVQRRRPFVDPTFGEYEVDLSLNRIPAAQRASQLECSYRSARELRDAGARLVIGTDAPMVRYGSGFHDELAHYLRAGFRAEEILEFATVNNAEYLGRGTELGRIAVGYRADFVLARDNPYEKLDTLRRPVWTMLDGQVVPQENQ